MYPQHERATQNLVALFKEDPEVLAVILAGSLAKGLERPDSDVDAIIAVTEEKYRRLQMEGRTSECIEEGCGYEGGYFDLKYYTKDYLLAAAAHGSEPTRYAFTGSYCLFSRDAELPEIVARIPVFQKAEKEEKMLSFYAALLLYSGYFWDCSKRENRAVSVPEKPDEGCRCPAGGKEAGGNCRKGEPFSGADDRRGQGGFRPERAGLYCLQAAPKPEYPAFALYPRP